MAERVDLAHEPDFALGRLTVAPSRRELIRDDGAREVVEHRVMQVLVALHRADGAVVTRDELTFSCWNGRIVGEDAINRVISRLRKAADGIGARSFRIETVTKIGYRLVADAPAAVAVESAAAAKMPRQGRPPTQRKMFLWVGAAILLLIAAVAAWTFLRPSARAAGSGMSIAILPFRAAEGEDRFLADGLAEQIRSDLVHRSDLEALVVTAPLARLSSAAETGRALGVDHVLEGQVGRSGGALRVEAALIESETGRRIWTERIEGGLDDVLGLQERIGARLTSALSVQLLPATAEPSLTTSGDVYALYLTARGLIRSRQSHRLRTAVELLGRAVELDPDFAPGWSSLGTARYIAHGGDSSPSSSAERIQAMAEVRRALNLAPDFAEAHGALGMMLGFRSAEAREHIMRGVRLDPNSAELQYWYGHARGIEGDFAGQVAAYRRSVQLDPLWSRSSLDFVISAAELNLDDIAAAEVQRFARVGDPEQARISRAWLASAQGDYSEAARQFGALRDSTNPLVRYEAIYGGSFVHLRLGMTDDSFPVTVALRRARTGPIPPLGEIRRRNAGVNLGDHSEDFVAIALKRLVLEGRGAELVDLFDSRIGLLEISRHSATFPRLVHDGADVALALRQAGRVREAEILLNAASRAIDTVLRRGRPPSGFLADAARVRAARGEADRALDLLEQAVARRWTYGEPSALSDIAEEPAFQTIRDHPRFARLRRIIVGRLARERRELATLEA